MKAIVYDTYGRLDRVRLEDIDRPVPGADQILVRVHAASVNAADNHLLYGRPRLMRLVIGLFRPKIRGLGLDYAGVVEVAGDAVTGFHPGDAVFGELPQNYKGNARTFAEYVCVPATSAVRKPDGVSFVEAAAVPLAGCTALFAVREEAGVRPGQHVLVNGAAGGVGSHAVQLAKHAGATVTAVCSAGKADRVRDAGADHVIDYRTRNFTEGDTRYDVIIDIAGGQPLSRCERVLTPGGRYVWVGAPAGKGVLGPLRDLFSVLVRSLFGGGERWRFVAKTSTPADVAALGTLMTEGALRPLIDRCYPLEQVPDALRHLEEGRACGKVVIET